MSVEKTSIHEIEKDDAVTHRRMLPEAVDAENNEHSMGIWEAANAYPMACFWAFIVSFTIVMESFDMFLTDGYVIPTRWQTALTQAGQIGALLGVFISGPITTRLRYRWTTMIGLMLMNATIFISFFADSLPVFLVGQLFPGGFFIANSPAYASEIVPIPLRGRASKQQNSEEVLAVLVRTIDIEAKSPTYIDLLKRTALRRTIITCLVYAGQNFAGNLIANQAVFFFEQAGMTTNFSFALARAHHLLPADDRHRVLLVPQRVLMASDHLPLRHLCQYLPPVRARDRRIRVSKPVVFALTLGPISYTILSKTSSVRLRALSIAVGHAGLLRR
ncbi:hypothetical protein K438DRAFT_1965652 [Mycena galopus ATCC 62051]|nr:hypothetical protein K438DRAFT_1965652 [Mycena galopus ATCC 62051]